MQRGWGVRRAEYRGESKGDIEGDVRGGGDERKSEEGEWLGCV